MTTLAYRSGVLAFDTQVTAGWGGRVGTFRKGAVVGQYLIGCSGTLHACQMFMRWFTDAYAYSINCGELIVPPPHIKEYMDEDDSINVLVIRRDGKVFSYDGVVHPYEIDGEFHARGSGSAFALGAMEMGASARQAVEAAIKWDTGSGGTVQTLNLSDIPVPESPDNVVRLRERRKAKRGK